MLISWQGLQRLTYLRETTGLDYSGIWMKKDTHLQGSGARSKDPPLYPSCCRRWPDYPTGELPEGLVPLDALPFSSWVASPHPRLKAVLRPSLSAWVLEAGICTRRFGAYIGHLLSLLKTASCCCFPLQFCYCVNA